MATVTRFFLYLMAFVLMITGLAALTMPDLLLSQFKLTAVALQGRSELRSLMGGGFTAFGVCLVVGLQRSRLAAGMLIGMTLIMAAATVGRIIGFAVDGIDPRSAAAALGELSISLACWWQYRALDRISQSR